MIPVLSDFTGSCYSHNPITASEFFYPALDPAIMSPILCQETCKIWFSDKALIDDGSLCKCINNSVTVTQVDNKACKIPCSGNRQLKCGGLSSGALVLPRIAGTPSLTCTVPSQQPTFTKFDAQFTASKPFYDATSYLISSGDGYFSSSTSANFPFMFINLQNYTTYPEVRFKNNQTGEYVNVPCSNSITSYMTTTSLTLSCPRCAKVNTDFTCNATYTQSSGDVLTVTMDGVSKTVGLPGT